jgi:hypothetical protein
MWSCGVVGLGDDVEFCVHFFPRVGSSDCLMGRVSEVTDETGYVCVYFTGEGVF